MIITSISISDRLTNRRRDQSDFITESIDLELVLSLDLGQPASIQCLLSFLSVWHFWGLDEASDHLLMQIGFSAEYSKAACLQGYHGIY